MNPTRKRTFVRIGVVLIAGLAFLIWTLQNRSRGFVVENHSGKEIERLSVTLAGETRIFQEIADGAQVSGTFKMGGDDRFTLQGRLSNNTRIHASGKAGEDFHFLILPGGEVKIRRGKDRGS